MKLYCARHGIAAAEDAEGLLALTDKGRAEVERLAGFLASNKVHIDHIMHSSKLRAKQTAEIFAKHLSVTHLTECEFMLDPEQNLEPLLSVIESCNEDTMVVGHLPYIAKLVSALVVRDQYHYPILHYPPATVACLDYVEGRQWIFDWILRPDLIPAG